MLPGAFSFGLEGNCCYLPETLSTISTLVSTFDLQRGNLLNDNSKLEKVQNNYLNIKKKLLTPVSSTKTKQHTSFLAEFSSQ